MAKKKTQPSTEGYPQHLWRLAVVDANKRSLLRTNVPQEAIELHSRTPGSRVMFLVGMGTWSDPTRWVEVK